MIPKKLKEFIYKFCEALSIPIVYFEKDLQESRLIKKIRSREPFILLEGISREQQERILVLDTINRYVYLVSSPARVYHMGPALAHVTGYVGKPTTSDLQGKEIKSYQLVGKGGIESNFDSILRGQDDSESKKEIRKATSRKRELSNTLSQGTI